ncbi:MAG: hypothetical protein V4471_04420 [Pseudomonadota bacterium]
MNKKEFGINVFSSVLSFSQVVVDGLSSVRQIVDFTSARWAKYAACSASIVEGEIYRKNIIEALYRLKLSKKALLKFLIIQEFEADLAAFEQYESELRIELHNFFSRVKQDVCKLDEEEEKHLKNYISLFEEKNTILTDETLREVTLYFKNLKNKRDGTRDFIQFLHVDAFELLEEKIEALKKKREEIDCAFLRSYRANKNFLKNTKTLKASKYEIKEAKKRLKCLRKTLVDCVAYPENSQFLHIPFEDPKFEELNEEDYVLINNYNDNQTKPIPSTINPHLILKLQKKLTSTKLKLWLFRFNVLFSLAAGIASGVITFYTFPVVLAWLGFSLSLTALSAVIWPLAILAAISYGLLIYNTLADLTINETLSKWWKNLNKGIEQTYHKPHFIKYVFFVVYKIFSQFFSKLINWFKPKREEEWFKYSLRLVLSLLVIGFGVVAALATGYTAFIQLQAYVNVTVCVITALPLLLSDFIFTLKNSFESIGLLTAISFANLRDPIIKAKDKLKKQMLTENYLQLMLHLIRLPLKFLLEFFKFTIFIFHVGFTAVASDRLFNFPCWLAFIFSFGSELLTDICPLFGKDKGHHDHNHGGLFSLLSKGIFVGPATILGILNYICSQLNRLFTSSDLQTLSFRQAIKQEWEQFDIWHFHAKKEHDAQSIDIGKDEQQLPREVVLQKSIKICDKQIKRLENTFFNSKLAQEKTVVFKEYKIKLAKVYQSGSTFPSLTVENKTKLAKHRFFNSTKKTESMRQLDKLQHWFREDKDYNTLSYQTNGAQRMDGSI